MKFLSEPETTMALPVPSFARGGIRRRLIIALGIPSLGGNVKRSFSLRRESLPAELNSATPTTLSDVRNCYTSEKSVSLTGNIKATKFLWRSSFTKYGLKIEKLSTVRIFQRGSCDERIHRYRYLKPFLSVGRIVNTVIIS